MRKTVFEYIDYNRQRSHSTLGHISPEAFEARVSCWARPQWQDVVMLCRLI
jgi:transposase InsO family protein